MPLDSLGSAAMLLLGQVASLTIENLPLGSRLMVRNAVQQGAVRAPIFSGVYGDCEKFEANGSPTEGAEAFTRPDRTP